MENRFEVLVTHAGGYRFAIDFQLPDVPHLLADEPPPLGGAEGPNPARLLAGAIANASPPASPSASRSAGSPSAASKRVRRGPSSGTSAAGIASAKSAFSSMWRGPRTLPTRWSAAGRFSKTSVSSPRAFATGSLSRWMYPPGSERCTRCRMSPDRVVRSPFHEPISARAPKSRRVLRRRDAHVLDPALESASPSRARSAPGQGGM